MNARQLLADIFERLLAPLREGKHSCLKTGSVSEIDQSSVLKAPVGTAVILGFEGRKEEPLAVLAITSPQLSPDNPELLALACRRSQAFKAPYFITWTLRDASLWKTPKPGTPPERGQLEKLRDYEDNYQVPQSMEAEAITEPVRLALLADGRRFLDDLQRLQSDQALELVDIDATYFVHRLIGAVHELLPIVAQSVHERLAIDTDFRKNVENWALTQGIAGAYADSDFSVSLARQIIYRLLGKILFYQSLRRAARDLPFLDLSGVDPSQILATLRRAFGQALKIDYHAVFAEDLPDVIQWPTEATKRLAALIADFNTRNFASLHQDVVGTVFERLIPPEDRHLLGQYFTPEILCDIAIAFCVQTPQAIVADPTCGTGTFLIRAYDRKRWLGNHNHVSLLGELWGVDIAPFPAELAVINLFRQNLSTASNFPRILCRDFFSLIPGETVPFPPPKMDISHPEVINAPIPMFDAIVGNFPYVRADQIARKDSRYLDFLRACLLTDWIHDYPDLFCCTSRAEQAKFEKAISLGQQGKWNCDQLQLRISSYADLYIYLFFHAARFLKPGGRMGILTSAAWLDVNYGYELQRFLCNRFKIVAILESRCEPWFAEASVNTVLTIVERCESPEERDRHLVKFVKVKKRLGDMIPLDPELQPLQRWQSIGLLAQSVEDAGRKYSKTRRLGVRSEEDDHFRIRICRQEDLRNQLVLEEKTAKWGQYLRAPDVFFELLSKGKFCLLRDVAMPRYGSKTRINEFFHVDQDVIQSFKIESEYVLPLLKSPKDSNRIALSDEDVDLWIFVCRKSKEELRSEGHLGALKYIEWGARQVYSKGEFKGMPWPKGTWVAQREPGWYSLPESETPQGQVFFGQSFGDRHMHRFATSALIPDCRLYYLEPQANLSSSLLAAIINSSIFALACEIFGRVTMGDGVLELKVEDARDYLLVPDLRGASTAYKKEIVKAFEQVCDRDIGDVFEEENRKDRRALDSAVLKAIGLDPQAYLKDISRSLCELVAERKALGQLRSKIRKTRTRTARAEREIFQDVLTELLPNGCKSFPEDFVSPALSAADRIEVPIPDGRLELNTTPFMMGLYAEKTGLVLTIRSPAEGKFILYSKLAGLHIVAMPVKPVEISRTVANYEGYLRQLRSTLYEAYYRRTFDVGGAERMAQAAFESLKLPKILGD